MFSWMVTQPQSESDARIWELDDQLRLVLPTKDGRQQRKREQAPGSGLKSVLELFPSKAVTCDRSVKTLQSPSLHFRG